VHLTLESRMNSGYSLNLQCWIIYSQLHIRIAINFSTLMGQIQHSICPIIRGLTECLDDNELMYHFLRHGSCIPDLPKECSWKFPCSGMKFRYTSYPLCCQVWWSQIWHCMHILFQMRILTSRQSLLTYHSSPGMRLNCVYPLHITLEQFILHDSKHIFFLPECFESVAASIHWVSSFTAKCLGVGTAHPTWPQQISQSLIDRYVKAATEIP